MLFFLFYLFLSMVDGRRMNINNDKMFTILFGISIVKTASKTIKA